MLTLGVQSECFTWVFTTDSQVTCLIFDLATNVEGGGGILLWGEGAFYSEGCKLTHTQKLTFLQQGTAARHIQKKMRDDLQKYT